jgi:hypothetical protein
VYERRERVRGPSRGWRAERERVGPRRSVENHALECGFVRTQHVSCGLDTLLSNRKLEYLAGGASCSRRRRSSTSRQPEEEERRGKQGAGPHEHAGPSRPNVSLSFAHRSVSTSSSAQPNAAYKGTAAAHTHRYVRRARVGRVRHAARGSQPATGSRPTPPSSLSSCSRRLVSARLVLRPAFSTLAAFSSRVGALAAVRARDNVPARSIQTFAQT